MTGSNSATPLLIALTGGIASGKTAVADLFAKLDVPVLDTDQIARDVVAPGMPALGRLVAQFGPEILDAQGRLDRVRMRERVFGNPEQRHKLEAITHPAIREELARRSAAAGGDYQIHVIPLLVETGRADAYDRVLVVDCPEEAQMARLMARESFNLGTHRRFLNECRHPSQWPLLDERGNSERKYVEDDDSRGRCNVCMQEQTGKFPMRNAEV